MNEIEIDAEWTETDAEDDVEQDWFEPESSSLTWDEEIVRETHREIAFRARKASSERLGW